MPSQQTELKGGFNNECVAILFEVTIENLCIHWLPKVNEILLRMKPILQFKIKRIFSKMFKL